MRQEWQGVPRTHTHERRLHARRVTCRHIKKAAGVLTGGPCCGAAGHFKGSGFRPKPELNP